MYTVHCKYLLSWPLERDNGKLAQNTSLLGLRCFKLRENIMKNIATQIANHLQDITLVSSLFFLRRKRYTYNASHFKYFKAFGCNSHWVLQWLLPILDPKTVQINLTLLLKILK